MFGLIRIEKLNKFIDKCPLNSIDVKSFRFLLVPIKYVQNIFMNLYVTTLSWMIKLRQKRMVYVQMSLGIIEWFEYIVLTVFLQSVFVYLCGMTSNHEDILHKSNLVLVSADSKITFTFVASLTFARFFPKCLSRSLFV